MAENAPLIRFNLVDGDVRPPLVRAHDLAEVLQALEDIIESIVFSLYQVPREELVIGLVVVEPGSVQLGLAPSLPDLALPAWGVAIRVAQHSDYRRLPHRAVQGFKRIVAVTKKYNCSGELRLDEARAVITPDTVPVAAPLIRGNTTLYGYLLRVGGRRPKVLLATTNGTIACDTTQQIARNLGNRLYSYVGVSGQAQWNAETLKVETFRIESVTPYTDTSPAAAMRELSERYGHYFDDIDVLSYVAELRGDDEDG